jgi:uncharacterized protein (UPF0261 family)
MLWERPSGVTDRAKLGGRMKKSIVVFGTLDTKGDQIGYLKTVIEREGEQACVIDYGVLGEVPLIPDFSRDKVAAAAGTTIQGILDLNNRQEGLVKMGEGVARIIKDLLSERRLSGVIAVGGSQGTGVSLMVMKTVPLGVPKLVLSTIAYSPVIIPEDIGGVDLMVMPWVTGLWGLNSLSMRSIETAAGAICGAARTYNKRPVSEKKVVGVSSLGGSVTRYASQLKPALEERGYEVAVSHVLGMPGRMYERAILDGFIAASLDLSAGVELLNELTGGVYTAGPHRMEAAGRMGIPQIVSPGAIEAFHWGRDRPFPDKYRDRPGGWHSALHRTVFSTPEEMAAVATVMAEKLNGAKGPVAVVLPLKGLGSASYLPSETLALLKKGMSEFRDSLKRTLNPEIGCVELDVTFNDPVYADTVLEIFDEMMRK